MATNLVGYTEAVRTLRERFTDAASVVLFGGLAKERPYPGSTAVELAPHRVNALHPGVVGDTPKWRDTPHPAATRTPIGRLVSTDEVADAVDFLLRNGGTNAHNLHLDGGFTAT